VNDQVKGIESTIKRSCALPDNYPNLKLKKHLAEVITSESSSVPGERGSWRRAKGIRASTGGILRARLSPVDRVDKAGVHGARAEALKTLARQFESKDFLPALPDIRFFLEMRGASLGLIKHRVDAFRLVLLALLQMSDADLQSLVAGQLYGRRNRLAPLLEAIRASSVGTRPIRQARYPTENSRRISRGSTSTNRKRHLKAVYRPS
jgi:hypothetical protein